MRRPRMTSVLWGWRLEGALALGTYVALRLSNLVGPGGPVLLVGLAAIAAWQLPSQRRALLARLRTAHSTRVMTAAFWRCQILGRDGRVPRVVKVTSHPRRTGATCCGCPRDSTPRRSSRGSPRSRPPSARVRRDSARTQPAPRSPSSSSSLATCSSTGSSDPPCSTPRARRCGIRSRSASARTDRRWSSRCRSTTC